MAEDDGLLSQEEINAALAEAGFDPALMVDGTAAEPEAGQNVGTLEGSAARPFDEVAAAMAEAVEQENYTAAASGGAGGGLPGGAFPFAIPELGGKPSTGSLVEGIDLLRDVELNVNIELGRSRMLVDDVLRLGEGSVVELDKLAGDPVDVYVNGRLVARGEVLVLNDNFCVRINDIIRQESEESAE